VEKLRVAVVGLGKMGLLHVGILASMPEVQLVAVCDQSKLVTKMAKKIFKEKVAVVKEARLLVDLNLDAVYITTPIPSHFHVVKSIFNSGITRNIFTEKTLAEHLDESEQISLIARNAGGVTMVGYQKRFGVTFNKAYELLKEDVIGSLLSFKAYAYSSDFVGIEQDQTNKLSGSRGGVLRDLGSHAISLALWYFGEITVVHDKSSINNACSQSTGFTAQASNVEGCIEASWCKKGYRMPDTGVIAEGSKGRLFVNDDKVEVQFKDGSIKRWFRQNLDDSVDFVLWSPEYYREDHHFINCILNKEKPCPDFFEASKVDKIIHMVTEHQC
jgi:predicted dehydrogenase